MCAHTHTGTTTNSDALISFKLGAFSVGQPVQPVTIAYPSKHTLDPSWVSAGPWPHEILFRLMCQLHNSMEVHFLDPYTPNEEEVKDPLLFANNVRRIMAQDAGIETTNHSFDDILLLIEVRKRRHR